MNSSPNACLGIIWLTKPSLQPWYASSLLKICLETCDNSTNNCLQNLLDLLWIRDLSHSSGATWVCWKSVPMSQCLRKNEVRIKRWIVRGWESWGEDVSWMWVSTLLAKSLGWLSYLQDTVLLFVSHKHCWSSCKAEVKSLECVSETSISYTLLREGSRKNVSWKSKMHYTGWLQVQERVDVFCRIEKKPSNPLASC